MGKSLQGSAGRWVHFLGFYWFLSYSVSSNHIRSVTYISRATISSRNHSQFLNCLTSLFVYLLTLGSMLYSFIQRVPSTLRPAISQSLLRPKYSKRMSSTVSQTVATTHQPDVSYRSLALTPSEDNPDIRQKYRPFILDNNATEDWVNNLDLTTAADMAEQNLRATNERLKVLVLYGIGSFPYSFPTRL